MNKKPIVLGVILILLMAIIIPIISSFKIPGNKIIYVDDDNKNGPWDGTMEHPYQFIHDGIKHAIDTDTVFVLSGNYIDFLFINKSINLIGENRNTTIINKYSENLIVIYISSDYVNISNFTIQNNSDCGIFAYNSNNIKIYENNFYQCKFAISLYSTFNVQIYKNNINFNNFTGIEGFKSHSILITENNIKNNSRGINQELSSLVIQKNNISANRYGIELHDCSDSCINENEIISNKYRGINLITVSKSEIKNNKIISNGAIYRYNPMRTGHGLYLSYLSNCSINKNNIDSNDRGITIINSDNNTISRNNISNNSRSGVYISDSFDNQINLNNFINNNIQAKDDSMNSWDYNKKGNYWDDFEEKYPNAQKTSRGVWDTPYEIYNGNQDRYPLIKPYVSNEKHITKLNNIIYVDDDGEADYTKIQDAIDNASDGDTVFVYNGTYYENIVIGKSIDLIGENRNNTIIDGAGIGCCLMGIAENIYISGFTFSNSSKDILALIFFDGQYTFIDNVISYNKRGIYCSDAKINVTNNIILNNEWGIAFENLYHSNIVGNIIQNNSDFGVGLFNCFYSVIQDNQISDNNYGIKITASWSNIVNENNITNNTIGVGVESYNEFSTGQNKILNNYITDNDHGVYLHAFGWGHCQSSTVSMNIISKNKYGIYLTSDTNESELYLNDISQNHIEKNEKYGIYLNNTYQNSISSNNLVKNKINAYFEYCNNLTWNGNYWNRPRLLSYPIFGKTTFKNYEIPWVNIDWHPALKPYDIVN